MTAMTSIQIEAHLIRPGHTVRLDYGPTILIDVEEVHEEPEWLRLCGQVRHPGHDEPYDRTDKSRHKRLARFWIVADRNNPPAEASDGFNDADRVCRLWDGPSCIVWTLDDPDEPLGHGGVLAGTVTTYGDGWAWRATYADASGEAVGDYLQAERALLDATSHFANA